MCERKWVIGRLFRLWLAGVLGVFISSGLNAEGSSASSVLIERVLSKADTAFVAKRYTLPKHNNAFDRYRAVLMIDTSNTRAARGLAQIEAVYVALIEGELESGSAQTAKYYVGVLGEYFPESQHLSGLKQKVALSVPQVFVAQDANDFLVKRYALAAGDLAARNAQAKQFVGQIAQRVEKTKEMVLILARNDAEGRWIYQVMNEATPTYRVRGDIQLRKTPAIHLLEPL